MVWTLDIDMLQEGVQRGLSLPAGQSAVEFKFGLPRT